MGQYSRCLAEARIRTTSTVAGPFDGTYSRRNFSSGLDDKLERRSRVRLCKLQRPDSLVKATDDTCHDRRTDHVNVWAPEIFYDEDSEQFMVVWASCIPGRFERGIEEENNNHRLYYITTKDFKTISKAKVLYDPGFSSIDAVLVKRDKNDYVMVLKDNTRPERNLKIAFADSLTGPYSPASQPFTESFVEGPTVEKIGEEYLVYFDVYQKRYTVLCAQKIL